MVEDYKNLYLNLPKISQEFIDEVFIRTDFCRRSLELIEKYIQKEHKNKKELNEFQLIKEMTGSFLVMQVLCLVDGVGKFSIVLQKNKDGSFHKIQTGKLKKLFPTVRKPKFNIMERKLNLLFIKYRELIFKLEENRHLKVAHAGVSYFDFDIKKIRFNDISIKHFQDFINEFQLIFVNVGFENDI